MNIIKSGTCPKLRGGGPLTYQIGLTTESKIALRVTENNRFGGGSFSDKWRLLDDIEAVLSKGVFTSKALSPIIRGDNNNTGFVMAVLLHEGLVRRTKKQPRRYERGDREAFKKNLREVMVAKPPIPIFKA